MISTIVYRKIPTPLFASASPGLPATRNIDRPIHVQFLQASSLDVFSWQMIQEVLDELDDGIDDFEDVLVRAERWR